MIMQELLERVWLTRLIDQVDSSKRCIQDRVFACVDDMSKQVQFFFEATLFGSPQGKPTRRTSARWQYSSSTGRKYHRKKFISLYLIFRFLLLCDVVDGVLLQENSFYPLNMMF